MPFSYRQLFLGRSTFCCCLPVRLGVIAMSVLGLLVAGLLTVVLWFEIASSSSSDLTGAERAAFVVGALTETVLFAASLLGLVGAITRKQSFTQLYAYILYVHFLVNLGVAAYLAFEITRVTNNAERVACQTAIKTPEAQDQCTGLLSFAKWVYWVIAGVVLVVEFYGAIIVTRYLYQLKREKGDMRAMRMHTEDAFQLKSRGAYTQLQEPTTPGRIPPLDSAYLGPSDVEFDPYTEVYAPEDRPSYPDTMNNKDMPAPPIEAGYGGGSWTHHEIATEEKARLQRQEAVSESNKNQEPAPPFEDFRSGDKPLL
ncbi:hypothetical protein D9613_000733 [Agrocybe pediades]|uniref:Uncharacterized protein n=1 Tax=Agrocybe pediades TaxID=84607 RepID=A0A8H4R122_9AGAR|nr:hypothetical protein D9613_000733 [Agrocybe pediades]KAF9566711.1 hypothetical protein CPC08DRAFT_703673 [Agrocybe pediades]